MPRLPRTRQAAESGVTVVRERARELSEGVSWEEAKRRARALAEEPGERKRIKDPADNDTKKVMRRAENAATAGAPVEAGLEPLDGPGHLEMMARGGGEMGPPSPDSPARPRYGRRPPASDADHVGGMTMEALVTGEPAMAEQRGPRGRGGAQDAWERHRNRSPEARASDRGKQADEVVYDARNWDPDENDLLGVDDTTTEWLEEPDDPLAFDSRMFGGGSDA